MRIEKDADAAHDFDLARFGHAGETTGEFAHHLVLPRAELLDLDLRRAESDPVFAEKLHLIHHAGDVQQGFRRNATDVQADAAERRIALDEDCLHAEVGAAEGGAVAAGARAEDQHLAFDVGLAGILGWSRRARRRTWSAAGGRWRRRGRRFCRVRGCCRLGRTCFGGLEREDHAAFAHLVADLDPQLLYRARGGRRHVHRRLVGFQCDERILGLDRIARFDEYLDDRHVLEVADIGNLDLDRAHVIRVEALRLLSSWWVGFLPYLISREKSRSNDLRLRVRPCACQRADPRGSY